LPKRGLGAQLTAFTVIVVCVVAAIGVFSLTQSETTSSSSEGTHPAASTTSTTEATTCAPSPGGSGNATVTITQTVGQWPGCDCALVASNSQGALYVSTNAKVGDDVCLAASLNGSDIAAFTITNSTGSVVLQTIGCVSSGGLGASPSNGISCETDWDTAAPTESGGAIAVGTGPVTTGTYTLAATEGQGSPAVLQANFTLLANSETSPTCTNLSSSSSSSTGNSQGHYVVSAVTPNVFFNNSIYQGPPVKFTVVPGSHAAMIVNVSYPWQNVQPPSAQGFCIEFSFTIGPFPASSNASTIPNWMHVSTSPPSVDIPYGSNASVDLLVGVDGTAPQESGGSFELLIHYFDPASGNDVVGSYIVSVQT
jgi:hypothetical protein